MVKLITWGILATQLVLPMAALAQNDPPVIPTPDITNVCELITKINTIINWLLVFLIILAIIFVIVAAFNYLTAGGDAEKVGAANKRIIYAAVAVAVGLLAKAVPFVVAGVLGVDIGTDCITN